MRLAAALAIAVGFVLGYAMLPALRPAGESGTPLPTGAPVALEEESAGAPAMSRAAVPGRGGIPVPSRRPSPAASTMAAPRPAPLLGPAEVSARPSARVASAGGHHAVTGTTRRGVATWYCCTKGHGASELVAAAGPALRVGDWRGRIVWVNGLRVRLVDWCGCPGRLIDLHPGAFRQLGALSRGVLSVKVTW